ncbi:hypothetical protein CUROG_05950 [Corynebacterium urogenitale]|uniref:Uncharacterized protein n=1 Tax=Corynebacterium urogenitale TaxID=2487892 RepID=A0A5J6ZA16_9CORY|nr:hypothetical protein [Corynebacterium urogenitale]QFQ02553.1 hypothetical protein CUROG_05950 [Corynebacterium urogenitale]
MQIDSLLAKVDSSEVRPLPEDANPLLEKSVSAEDVSEVNGMVDRLFESKMPLEKLSKLPEQELVAVAHNLEMRSSLRFIGYLGNKGLIADERASFQIAMIAGLLILCLATERECLNGSKTLTSLNVNSIGDVKKRVKLTNGQVVRK